MKIAITGASGFVGAQLVACLAEKGAELLLVGRNPDQLARQFPGQRCCGYETLCEQAAGFDLLVHCAVANTTSSLSEAEIFAANVDLVEKVADQAAKAGVKRFLHLSSFHALDEGNQSAYARSKRQSIVALRTPRPIDISVLYLPALYGAHWAGKLAILNHLPAALARTAFRFLAALKPTLSIATLAETIEAYAKGAVSASECVLADDMDQNGWYRFGKRLMDLGFALAVIAFLGWALVLVWMAVKLQSPGPGIFAQARVGRHGRVFTCYKFRTMAQGTRQGGTHEVSAASITKIGAFLRRTKIDELPQVWNILKNEMSLVGPRPCLPIQKELIAERNARQVLEMLPGITGLAQINNIDMSTPALLADWDNRYAKTRSLILDIKILLATALGRGQGDKVRG